MLIGEYKHNLDPKKRLAVPAKLRKDLGERAVLTRGLDNCLFLYPAVEFQKLTERLAQLPTGKSDIRSLVRSLLAGATEVELDGLGRILIPDYLKQYAGIKQDVVIIGISDLIEIWAKEKWNEFYESNRGSFEELADKLISE